MAVVTKDYKSLLFGLFDKPGNGINKVRWRVEELGRQGAEKVFLCIGVLRVRLPGREDLTLEAKSNGLGKQVRAEQEVARMLLDQLEKASGRAVLKRVGGFAEVRNGDYISALCMTCAQNHLPAPDFQFAGHDGVGKCVCTLKTALGILTTSAEWRGKEEKKPAKQAAARQMYAHAGLQLAVQAYAQAKKTEACEPREPLCKKVARGR